MKIIPAFILTSTLGLFLSTQHATSPQAAGLTDSGTDKHLPFCQKVDSDRPERQETKLLTELTRHESKEKGEAFYVTSDAANKYSHDRAWRSGDHRYRQAGAKQDASRSKGPGITGQPTAPAIASKTMADSTCPDGSKVVITRTRSLLCLPPFPFIAPKPTRLP